MRTAENTGIENENAGIEDEKTEDAEIEDV